MACGKLFLEMIFMKTKLLLALASVIFIGSAGYIYCHQSLEIAKVNYNSILNADDTKTVRFILDGPQLFGIQCSLDNGITWKNSILGACSYKLKSGDYTLLVRNAFGQIAHDFNIDINEIKSISLSIEKYHLAIGESLKLHPEVEYIGDGEYSIDYKSSDDSIAVVDSNGYITAKSLGEADILLSVKDKVMTKIKIIVTDIIAKPEFNLNKSYLKCNQYSDEEAKLLDEILKERIDYAGEGSRAATVEAARFLTLSFKYKIHYFFENGRLDYPTSGIRYADGEGRYHHKGLYLSKDKFSELDPKGIYVGPATWGCGLTNFDGEYGWTVGKKYDNGLDCSGFVTWALYNGGTDVGDVGAGIKDGITEMSDYGEMHSLTYEFANSLDYKVGDIIARWGHTAIIAGIDDEYIYIAESLLRGVRMEKYSYKNKNSDLYKYYTYINKMDDVYAKDGNITNMW